MGKITKTKFRKGVLNTGGILSQIAKKIGVSRNTVYDWIAKNKDYAEPLLFHEREKIIDLAEGSLFSQIQNKEAWATKYALSTIGKVRGYVEKQEVENSGSIQNDGNVRVEIVEVQKKEDD